MATFQRVMRVKSSGHGNSTGKDGKTRGKKIPRETFIRIAKENNGDIRKISEILYGEEKGKLYAAATKNRYESLSKEVTLPPMNFVQLRKHTGMTPALQKKLITEWQNSKGDANKVAKKLGVSAQTVVGWIKKFDEVFLEKNIAAIMKEFDCDRETALDKMSDEEGNISFVSPLYEKKKGTRGKKASELDASVLSEIADITEGIENLVGEIQEKEDKMAEIMAAAEEFA